MVEDTQGVEKGRVPEDLLFDLVEVMWHPISSQGMKQWRNEGCARNRPCDRSLEFDKIDVI